MCPPVIVIGRPQTTMRGPGASRRRMPSRSEKATLPLAPFSRSVVTPECSSVRAFLAACSMDVGGAAEGGHAVAVDQQRRLLDGRAPAAVEEARCREQRVARR